MKKLIFSTALVAAILAGCGGEEAAPVDDTANEVEQTETAAPSADEKEYFTNEIDQVVSAQMKLFDAAWADNFAGTFNGVADGSIDRFTAYDDMKTLKNQLSTVRKTIKDIDASGLSDENKELFETFQREFNSMILWRDGAVKIAQEVFDSNDASPSKMDKIKEEIALGDSDMMKAVIAYTQIKTNLGIEETQ